MKFTNGYWGVKEGIEPHFAACAYETEQQGDELVVYAPERQISRRVDTLNMQLLTIRYSSPVRGVIRARISHFKGGCWKTEKHGFLSLPLFARAGAKIG